MRLIDADAVRNPYSGTSLEWQGVLLLKLLDEAPTIDAVSVVRCKECRYCHGNYVDMTPPYAHVYCFKWSRYTTANDFCSYGARKEGE